LVGNAGATSAKLVGFQTPTKNIVCAGYTGAEPALLRCDIHSELKPKPARPKSCHFDFGFSLGLNATGRAQPLCVSDAVLPDPSKAPVLSYGKTWHDGPFTCTSAAKGLSCRNSAQHGFFLSRQSWKRI
jgi:hypothetical protein